MARPLYPSPLEVWGGVECTLNRVGEAYHDQLVWSGHYDRDDDLERFASLGLTALRYPVLWERWGGERDWTWLDRRLSRLRELGIRPIVGLVHHGSGPPGCGLLDDGFSSGLAAFAARVARRWPWITDYTPVNEPVTTARFAALYGHWHPHAQDGNAFHQALTNECRATLLAMEAIRREQPDARLIQTEDLGRVHSTPRLRYQADFENERRWLGFDMLCGRVEDPWFREHGRAPDVLGLNHYVTSERFLDEEADGPGNGRDRYGDFEAVRRGAAWGPTELILECWRRYGLPIALTEAHLGCTREEQMRWLLELWQSAHQARARGADVRAVTTWALLGSFDWCSLVTRPCGIYEPGAFDVRCAPPRPTAIAGLVRELASGRDPCHPVLEGTGWWRPRGPSGPPLLVTGCNARLATVVERLCAERGLSCVLTTRAELDIAHPESVRIALRRHEPWAVLSTAGAPGATRPESCWRDHYHGPATLAARCGAEGIPLVAFSSDHVFDGRASRPYRESDPARPLCLFGQAQRLAEDAVLRQHPGALVVRTAALLCPIVDDILTSLDRTGRFVACPGSVVSPTHPRDLLQVVLDLLLDGEAGLWHLTNRGQITLLELARSVARMRGYRPDQVVPIEPAAPLYRALESERGMLLPDLEHSLGCYVRQLERRLQPA